jgi:hypothetical protein
MTIVYYSTDYPKEQLYKLSQAIKDKIGKDVLFVPKDFHVLLNATTEQLNDAKQAIELAIKLKEKA